MDNTGTTKAHFSVPSIIALIAAIASFAVGAFWGFILALVAIFFGVIGMILALSPRIRGGIVSVFSIVVALAGIVVAAIKAIAWLLR
jgi:hypothetical protein